MAILTPLPFGHSTQRQSLPERRNDQRFSNPKGILAPRPAWALGGNPFGIFCALLVLAGGWIAGTLVAIAAETRHPEYEVKAAHLVNLPKYVDWPVEAFAGTNSPIVIAVLGESKVAEEILKVIAGRIIKGRNIVLKHMASGEGAGGCHILFIPGAEQKRSPNLLAKFKAGGILTVGESDDFLERGGIINLARRDQKIAVEVNLTAAGNARIKISSKLLSVAGAVKGKSK